MTMEQPSEPKKGHQNNIENQEQYILHNPKQIVQKLRLLQKNHCFITASFNGGTESLNTIIVDIIQDMDLIALDYGPTEELNQALLNANRIVFKTQLDGVSAQFTAKSITKAKYKDTSVFAIPIPEALMWIQRREFFRIRIPLGAPAHCEVMQDDGSYRQYRVFDLSIGGIAILDEYNDLEVEVGVVMSHCRLELPDHGNGQVNLEVKNIIPQKTGRRIGCSFVNLGMSFSATIQRYIHTIESNRKNIGS